MSCTVLRYGILRKDGKKRKQSIVNILKKKKVARIFMGAANQVFKLKLRKHSKRRKVRKRRVK